jgi:hypothetical protein
LRQSTNFFRYHYSLSQPIQQQGIYSDTLHPPPALDFHVDDMPDLFRRLSHHKLFFTAILPTQGPAWKALNTTFQSHVDTNSIILPPVPDSLQLESDNIQFHQLQWILLDKGRKRRDATYKYSQGDFNNGATVNSDFLVKLGKKTMCPLPAHPDLPVLLLGMVSFIDRIHSLIF